VEKQNNMKRILTLVAAVLISFAAKAQIIVNQSVSAGPYKVGDTITVTYTVDKGTTKPRYFWLRYDYNNKALTYVSTTFSQGTQSQTYYTSWNNYKFTAAANVSDTSLYAQYQATPWGYAVNNDWNVGQIAVQRVDQSVNGVVATQKYILKDQNTYDNIFKLNLSYATDSTSGANIPYIKTTSGPTTITGVTGNTSYFKLRVLFPTGYDVTKHQAQLMPLKTDGSGEIDWTKQAIASKAFDGSGEAIFTTGVKVGDSLGIWVGGATQQAFMNNIVTVSDAYKAFLGVSQTNIGGTQTFFTRPVLEKKIGLITKDKTEFSESDAYYLFAYVMGVDVKDKAYIPTNAAPVNNVVNYKWHSGLMNQSWLDGVAKHRVYITQPTQTVDAVFAWGGDLDWSHSSDPDIIASRIAAGTALNQANSGLKIADIKTMAMTTNQSNVYAQKQLEEVKLGITSTIQNGKVVLTTNLTKEGLAGLQVIMNYDSTKLDLENIIFDSGSTITNFSTKDNGRLTFGSIDQQKTARIKTGTPYKLIFNPKVSLSNTAGLFFFVLADAVDADGKKVELVIE
jgi:hypothetical protein